MKGLYDIFKCVLRCLREFEKWSWLGKIGKNEEKWGKMAVPESPIIHYCLLWLYRPIIVSFTESNRAVPVSLQRKIFTRSHSYEQSP